MISAKDAHDIAHSLKTAQDRVEQVEPPSSQYPGLDARSAYAVSRLIHLARIEEGAVAVGRKIGFTNRDLWPVFGVDEPVWGHVYDSTLVELTDGTGKFSLRPFAEPRLEPELVFHFRTAPAVGGSLEDILACVDWVAHAFEVVQSHYPGWKFRAADTIADSALHGALLLGPRVPIAELGPAAMSAIESFSLDLSCNAQMRAKGRGSNVLGSPLAAIAHLSSVLANQPDGPALQAGELVTTGTITSVQTVLPGETWSTQLQGIALPGLSVEFTD